jgi:hypothetical protein
MTAIDGLASRVAQQREIDFTAARDVVSTYAGQISDDPDLWSADSETLSDDGVEVVLTAIATAYEHDLNSTGEGHMLDELEDITRRRAELVAELDDRRDQLVRTLMGTSVARKRIAEAAGLKEARLYQIRDGRR